MQTLLAMRVRRFALACLLVFLSLPSAAFGTSPTTAEASKHIGEMATVCGHVASTHYAPRSHAFAVSGS